MSPMGLTYGVSGLGKFAWHWLSLMSFTFLFLLAHSHLAF